MKSIFAFFVCIIPICAVSQVITSTFTSKSFHDGKKSAEKAAAKYGVIAENDPNYDLKERSRIVSRIIDLDKGTYRIANIKNFRNGMVQTDTDQPFSDVGSNISNLERDLKVINIDFTRKDGVLPTKHLIISNNFRAGLPMLHTIAELSGVMFAYPDTLNEWADTLLDNNETFFMNYKRLSFDPDTTYIKYWGSSYPIYKDEATNTNIDFKGITVNFSSKITEKSYEGTIKYNPATKLVYEIKQIVNSFTEFSFEGKVKKNESKSHIQVRNQITGPTKN
ncbi:MAG: hypothetical protein ACRCVT_14110 [Leadbetterella sp.]